MRKKNRSWVHKLLILFFATLTLISNAVAEDNIEEAGERISFIESRLESGTKSAIRWQYSWTSVFGASTAYNCVSILGTMNKDDEDQEHEHFDYKVNGIKSALAFGKMIADPLTAYSAYDKIRVMPDATFEDKMRKMRRAEQLLKQSAEREKAGRSWKAHALSITINLIAGAAIAGDDNRTSDALVSAATGIIVSEIQIFTLPTQAIHDWEEYHKRYYFNDYSLKRPSIKKRERPSRFFLSAIPFGIQGTYLF